MSDSKGSGPDAPAKPAHAAPPGAEIIDPDHVRRLREAGQPLFGLGSVYATPAVLEHLAKCGYLPNALLGLHVQGDYGELDEEDRNANDQAVVDGNRILSAYRIEGEKVYVITEAADDAGVRRASAILFSDEY
ncbi:MAG: hypothetical protein KF686_17165 [Ramlibacter sp.]|nr:hypothetical protein [Ramlibacter sp.]